MIKLQDKLYTSTEVADILGVSLRSVYRYIEEDKLHAEVKTATGRHRFTKNDILNFLYPEGVKEEDDEDRPSRKPVEIKVSEEDEGEDASKYLSTEPEPAKETTQEKPQDEQKEESEEKSEEGSEEDSVDWLSKFREAAKKFQDEQKDASDSEGITGLGTPQEPQEEEETSPEEEDAGVTVHYYKSALGGLKEIAQNIDKSARNAQLPYAFTLNAGLSLHNPIKPFSMLHAYVRKGDIEFYEKSLQLSEVDADSGQLCLIVTDETDVFSGSEELHGLFVVGKERLAQDIGTMGDDSLKAEAAGLLA